MAGADAWLYKIQTRPLSAQWFKDIRSRAKRIPKHLWQRATRGYSVYDMWNGDGFLADLIAATAYWHFAHNHGYPPGMTQEEWRDILLAISDGFTPDADDELVISDEAWQLLRENFGGLWD